MRTAEHVPYVYAPWGSPTSPLPRNGGNTQLGCGLSVREIKGRRYLYFWAYEAGPFGSRRRWTYVGPIGRPSTKRKAMDLLVAYHLKARREVHRRMERLLAAQAALP